MAQRAGARVRNGVGGWPGAAARQPPKGCGIYSSAVKSHWKNHMKETSSTLVGPNGVLMSWETLVHADEWVQDGLWSLGRKNMKTAGFVFTYCFEVTNASVES